MPKRRDYTRELLAGRRNSAKAFRDGRGPLLRIVAGRDESIAMPVEYAPRRTRDPKPWVQWNQHDGTEGFRFSGRECWAVPVTEDNAAPEFWAVKRTILSRLAARGIAMTQESGRDWSALTYWFADGSGLSVTGEDVNGLCDTSMSHTVGEHGRFRWYWDSADGQTRRSGEIPEGEQGSNFGRDAVALVMLVTSLAEEHGRAWQECVREDLNATAHRWAEENGAELPFPPAEPLFDEPEPAQPEPEPEAAGAVCGKSFEQGGAVHAGPRGMSRRAST